MTPDAPNVDDREPVTDGRRRCGACCFATATAWNCRPAGAGPVPLDQCLVNHPELRALCEAEQALHSLYRTRGYARAKQAMTRLTDNLAASALPELLRLLNACA